MPDLRKTASKNADSIFQLLSSLGEGLDLEQSHKANAKLLLLLANHIDDLSVIEEAVTKVKMNTENWSKPDF